MLHFRKIKASSQPFEASTLWEVFKDFELINKTMFATQSVAVLNWYMNSPMIKGENTNFEETDGLQPMEIDPSIGEPESWSNELIFSLKRSDASTERQLRSMRDIYMSKLREKRELLAKNDDNAGPLKKRTLGH